MTTFVGSQHDEYPYSAVVYIEATFSSGATYTGSGVMVGINDVLTAAHVIFSEEDGGAATSITVFPGYNNGDAPFGEYRAATFNYFEIDLDGDGLLSQFDSQTDVGIIGLSTAVGNQTGWFSITTNATAGSYNLTGYPGVYEGAFGPRMTNDFGAVTVDPNYWVFNYGNIESNSGNSGGPLWFAGSSGPEVIGLASTSGWAVDLTFTYDDILDWMEGNNGFLSQQLLAPFYVQEVGRLYEAGLGRQFDAGGLNYWIDQREVGMSMLTMSALFLDSAEFTSRFGDDDFMSNAQFIDRMYGNVLDRAPDAAGQQYWVNQMDNGFSRELALLSFSESAENLIQSNYLEHLQQAVPGFWDI